SLDLNTLDQRLKVGAGSRPLERHPERERLLTRYLVADLRVRHMDLRPCPLRLARRGRASPSNTPCELPDLVHCSTLVQPPPPRPSGGVGEEQLHPPLQPYPHQPGVAVHH